MMRAHSDDTFDICARSFPLERLLAEAKEQLAHAPFRRSAEFYRERLKAHLSGDMPSKRLARVLGRWRNFPFTLAIDGRPCEAGLSGFVLHHRQVCDAIDDDEDERSLAALPVGSAESSERSIVRSSARSGWLTIIEVSEVIGCTYHQARRRMQAGTIECVKDGRHIRSRREWVDAYLKCKLVGGSAFVPEVSIGRSRRAKPPKVKLQGIGQRFLQNRKK